MAWKFPKHNIKAADVVEIDDVNENFRGVVEEVGGALNEHNWKEDAFNTRAHLADDVGLVLRRVFVEADPNGDPAVTANVHRLQMDMSWQDIAGLTLSFTSSGGLFWILASMQASSTIDELWFTIATGGKFGIQFALSLNDSVLAQSLVGTADRTNDHIAYGQAPGPANIEMQVYNTPAPSSRMMSITTEAVVRVPPGKHEVKVVACPPMVSDDTAKVPANSKTIGSRELIVVELLR